MQVRNFTAGEKDRRDVLHDQIEAIEQHADAIADLILAHDWEPARSEEWADVRRCCKELGEILHRARWSAMWDLCELYRDDMEEASELRMAGYAEESTRSMEQEGL